MKLKFNFSIADFEGNEMVADAGKFLANRLLEALKGDAFKLFDWANKLHTTGELELDRSDTEQLKKFIQDHDKLAVLIKAKLLEPFTKEA